MALLSCTAFRLPTINRLLATPHTPHGEPVEPIATVAIGASTTEDQAARVVIIAPSARPPEPVATQIALRAGAEAAGSSH